MDRVVRLKGDEIEILTTNSPDELIRKIKVGLLQELLSITFHTINDDKKYFGFDDAVINGQQVSSDEQMKIIYTSMAYLQAKLDNSSYQAKKFISQWSDSQQAEFVKMADFIFNKMPNDRQLAIKSRWRDETDADQNEWQEIQELIASLK